MKPSLRVYCVRHREGLYTATLMRSRERPLAPPTPTAVGATSEEVVRHVERVLRARMLERTDDLADYLFEGEVLLHDVEIEVHPQRSVGKMPVIADTPIGVRLSYAIVAQKRGGFRVMLPRFGWWFVCETERSARPLIRQLISADLLGASGNGLLHYQRGESESILERTPSWVGGSGDVGDPAMDDLSAFPELSRVAEEWTLAARRRRLPTTVGELSPAHAALLATSPARSIVLVGPSGVGKTAWVRKAARHLAQRGEPRVRLWSTSAERLVGGMRYLGEWQARILTVLAELLGEEDFVHVGHLAPLVREQPGGGSIADFLLPRIRSGLLRVVAECDLREWQRVQGSSPDLASELTVVHLAEVETEAMPPLLRAYQERRAPKVELRLEGYRRLVSHLALAVRTSAFPGKGFRFLEQLVPDPDQAPARTLTPSDVSEAFAKITGLPLALVSDDVVRSEDELAHALAERVIGQDAACRAAASVLTRFKAGLCDEGRPLGVLFFVGPTGVGKTELAKQIARVMLGDERRMVRLDMSEFQLPGSSLRLIESGHGTSLAARVRAQPFSVVLFDEIEKAHPEIFDLLLGILGEGRLTDAEGNDVDFRSSVIVMTSNLGAGEGQPVGFTAPAAGSDLRKLESHFRPELVGRIDHVIGFEELGEGDVRRIVDGMLTRLGERTGLTTRRIRLEVTAAARDRLAALGYQPGKGARALLRVIEEEVVSRVGAEIAARPTLTGVTLVVDRRGDGLVLSVQP